MDELKLKTLAQLACMSETAFSRFFKLHTGRTVSDKWDLKLLGEIYTKGSWGLSAASNYRKRYPLNQFAYTACPFVEKMLLLTAAFFIVPPFLQLIKRWQSSFQYTSFPAITYTSFFSLTFAHTDVRKH